jgi:hypothetical protein
MLSVHRHGLLETNLREPRENVVVADEAIDFIFLVLPLIMGSRLLSSPSRCRVSKKTIESPPCSFSRNQLACSVRSRLIRL